MTFTRMGYYQQVCSIFKFESFNTAHQKKAFQSVIQYKTKKGCFRKSHNWRRKSLIYHAVTEAIRCNMYYLQHERPCCIGYTNSSRRLEFVYPIQLHGRDLYCLEFFFLYVASCYLPLPFAMKIIKINLWNQGTYYLLHVVLASLWAHSS
jgi:hypothetical protein